MLKIVQRPQNLAVKQECIPVGCVPLASLDVSTGGGRGRVGPQVNKFEQVSSHDHQMSLAVGGYLEGEWVVCAEEGVGMSRGRGAYVWVGLAPTM